MKLKTKKTLEVTLTMNAEEAYWLKCVLQNSTDGDQAYDARLRAEIFTSLPEFSVLEQFTTGEEA